METSRGVRNWLDGTLRVLSALGIVLIVVLIGLWLGSGYLRGLLIRYVERHYERQVRVAGKLEAHLLSLHPRIVAEGVVIGNPPWTPTGTLAEIGHLELTYDLPGFWHGPVLRRVEMRQASLSLFRDEAGRANWLARSPDAPPGSGPPLLHGLAMPDARVRLQDLRRHLTFDGTVSVLEVPVRETGAHPALRLSGAGQLNGREARFALDGEPLATVRRDRPYRFVFVESSSGSLLNAQGVLPKPFDFRQLRVSFTASGEDLRDLYFLTGVTLLDTGRYQLSGRFDRRGSLFEFTGLQATSGRSDVQGRVSIQSRPRAPAFVETELTSGRLRMADLGKRAAGREANSDEAAGSSGRLLSDKPFRLTATRDEDAVIRFNAQTLEAGRVVLQSVAAEGRIHDGVISVTPLSAAVRNGKVRGQVRIDVRGQVPEASLELRATGLELLQGPLQARVHLHGKGNSLHALASKADGRVTAVLPHGELRASIAELAGFDLRALGLKMTGDNATTRIRCGVASFDAEAGLLTARRLLLDTEPVLITGEGAIDLEHESLDMRVEGHPKHPRLRVEAPLLVQGNLRHPSFSADMKKPAAQAGGAIALGVLLSPVAAMLAFVDPGLAKDANCAALLAQASSESK